MKESWRIEIPLKIAEIYGKSDFYLYILFLIYAGVRQSEAYALEWKDISAEPIIRIYKGEKYETGRIKISKAIVRTKDNCYQSKNPKTEAGNRTLVLDWSFFKELYKVRQKGNPDERIFKTNPYCNDRKWQNIKKALALPCNLRQYDLRHYHATDIAYSGASEEEIMERMGHSTSAFSHSVYVEIFEEHEQDINANLAKKAADGITALQGI